MDRLTYRERNQHGTITGSVVYECMRLNTGESVYPRSHKEKTALKKLAKYEDAEESGRLIILPVAIGDTVFFISPWRLEVERGKVSMLQQKADGTWKMRITEGSSVFDRPMTDIGTKVFLTEADAEMALNEMRI